MMAEKFLIPNIPRLETVKVPPCKVASNVALLYMDGTVRFQNRKRNTLRSCSLASTPTFFCISLWNPNHNHSLQGLRQQLSHLKFMWLQFAVTSFGCQSHHIRVNGSQSLDVRVKYNRGDKSCRSTDCNTDVHHVVSGRHNQGGGRGRLIYWTQQGSKVQTENGRPFLPAQQDCLYSKFSDRCPNV